MQALPTNKVDSAGASIENTNTNDSQEPNSPHNDKLIPNGNANALISANPDNTNFDEAAAAGNNFVSEKANGKNQIVSLTVTIKLDPRANLLDKPTARVKDN